MDPCRNEEDIEVSKKRLELKKRIIRIILTNTIIERSSVGTEDLNYRRCVFMNAYHVAKLEISILLLNVSSIFLFKNVYTQNTLKRMRILLPIADKYELEYQFFLLLHGQL